MKVLASSKSKYDQNYHCDTGVTKRITLNVELRYTREIFDDQGESVPSCTIARSFNHGERILDTDEWMERLLCYMTYWTMFCSEKELTKLPKKPLRITMLSPGAGIGKKARIYYTPVSFEAYMTTAGDCLTRTPHQKAL